MGFRERWAEAIREARRAAGMSQAELAVQLGVHQVTVSDWETAKATPRDEVRPLIAQALGVNVYELFSYDEFPFPEAA